MLVACACGQTSCTLHHAIMQLSLKCKLTIQLQFWQPSFYHLCQNYISEQKGTTFWLSSFLIISIFDNENEVQITRKYMSRNLRVYGLWPQKQANMATYKLVKLIPNKKKKNEWRNKYSVSNSIVLESELQL